MLNLLNNLFDILRLLCKLIQLQLFNIEFIGQTNNKRSYITILWHLRVRKAQQ